MKRILLGVSMLAFIGAVVVNATGAFFTDHEISTGNTFTSGTMLLDVNNNGSTGTFNVNLGAINAIAPGDTTQTAEIIVKNSGTMNAATFGRFTISNDTGLGSYLKIYNYKVEYFKPNNDPVARWATNDPYYGTANNMDWFIQDGADTLWTAVGGTSNLAAWISGAGPLDIPTTAWDMEALKPGAYYKLTIQFQMDPAATNAAQGKSVTIGYEVKSTQIDANAITALGLGYGDAAYHANSVSYFNNQLPTQD